MTIQKAAYQILKEKGHPLKHKEIAKLALERGMVPSNASDPVFSLGTTLLKNIRENTYNIPKLCFIGEGRGQRLIGLPEWEDQGKLVRQPTPPTPPKSVEITAETTDMVELARLAGLGSNETETIDRLIREGFKVLKGEIETTLVNKVKRA